MDIKEAIRSGLKELILPEIDSIKTENKEIKIILEMTNKRLDDINLHLSNQSRRIDEINKKIDETKDFLLARIDETNKRINSTNQKIDETRDFLLIRIDGINKRLDRLYEVNSKKRRA